MARYEGMDEILQRLSLRFGQEAPAAGPAPESAAPPSPLPVATQARQYRAATESIGRLRQEAEHLCQVLTEPGAPQLSHQEHDALLALLGKALQDLWNCEVALQRVAPFD
jgi:hypothetical protein